MLLLLLLTLRRHFLSTRHLSSILLRMEFLRFFFPEKRSFCVDFPAFTQRTDLPRSVRAHAPSPCDSPLSHGDAPQPTA